MKCNHYAMNLWYVVLGGGDEIRNVTQVIVRNEMVRDIAGVNDGEIHLMAKFNDGEIHSTLMGFNGNK